MKWRKTKVQFPPKNAESGIYYARLFFNGKEVWKSLKTDVYSPSGSQPHAFRKDILGVRQQGMIDWELASRPTS